MPDRAPARLGVYVDARYARTREGTVTADIPFIRFACEAARTFGSVTLIGRERADGDPGRFAVPSRARLAPLPDYAAVGVGATLRALPGAARRMWRALDDLDAVWVFGPHPFAVLLAAMARARGRAVALGVRQDSREYFRARAGGARRVVLPAVATLDAAFRLMSRRAPTVVVGTDLARRYGSPDRPAIVTVFCQLTSAEVGGGRAVRDGVLLTVGRIEPEKDPALLVEAMAELERRRPGAFRLRWVGSGRLAAATREYADALGIADAIDFLGYMPFGDALVDEYRRASAFVHVSRTEGVPQVLFEAMGSGTPVVATAVGGVADALDGGRRGLLVPPGDRDAVVAAVLRLADDAPLRGRLRAAGVDGARRAALDVEGARLGATLAGALAAPRPTRRDRLAGAADRLGGSAVLRRLAARDRVTVLAYHRIGEPLPGFPFDDGLFSATPAAFARQMRWVAPRFTALSLTDFLAVLDGSRRCPPRPLLVTFDDGYADNREHALPVMQALGIPGVVFVATGALDTRDVPWWDAAAALLRAAPRRELDLPLVGRRSLTSAPERAATHRALRDALKEVAGEDRDAAMADLAAAVGRPLPRADDLMLTWDQARDLVRGGVECQPHTVTHPLLTRVGVETARREILGSMRRLREELGSEPAALAYPNGDNDATVRRVAREAGLRAGFTMRPGPARLACVRRDPFAIPRVAVEGGDTLPAFRLKASGVLPFVAAARRPRR